MTILDTLAQNASERVEAQKLKFSLNELKARVQEIENEPFRFEAALRTNGISFICECKKASPSKGLIAPYFPYLQIAQEYEQAGASCISVLTEPTYFLGEDSYLKEITNIVSIPCLRKDFTVDAYMIYEAKLLGAEAVLLICSILSPAQLKEYLAICKVLGLSALVEIHDKDELAMALDAGSQIIGVNNRNLKDFTVNTHNSSQLKAYIPPNIVFVSESGIENATDLKNLQAIGTDAVIIGETLMRAPNKKEKLLELKSLL